MASTTKGKKHQARKYVRLAYRQLRNDAKAGKPTDMEALAESQGFGSIETYCKWLTARVEAMTDKPDSDDLARNSRFLLTLLKSKYEADNPAWFVAESTSSGDTIFDEVTDEDIATFKLA